MNSKIVLIIYFLLILALIGGGYSLFLWFIINVMQGGAAFGLLFVAVVAGVASFFNPCSFPLVPAFFANSFSEDKKDRANALTAGFTAALGVTTFNILFGVLLGLAGVAVGKTFGLAGAEPSSAVLWLRGIAGVFILLLGVNHFTGRGLDFHKVQGKISEIFAGSVGQSKSGLFTYGFGYTLLGIGCGGPILTGLIVYAIVSGGFLSALSAFTIYAAVMAILMVIVASLVALSQESILTTLKSSTATIKKVSGVILTLVGIFLILSTIFVREFTSILFP